MENRGKKFVKCLVPYSTYVLIAGTVVLVETVPGLKYDDVNHNKFYTSIDVEDNFDINLELKDLNEFNYIEIMTLDGSIKLDSNDIDKISYINNNEEIFIYMVESLKYYVGTFNYNCKCYVFEEFEYKNTKNEIHQYVLKCTK